MSTFQHHFYQKRVEALHNSHISEGCEGAVSRREVVGKGEDDEGAGENSDEAGGGDPGS